MIFSVPLLLTAPRTVAANPVWPIFARPSLVSPSRITVLRPVVDGAGTGQLMSPRLVRLPLMVAPSSVMSDDAPLTISALPGPLLPISDPLMVAVPCAKSIRLASTVRPEPTVTLPWLRRLPATSRSPPVTFSVPALFTTTASGTAAEMVTSPSIVVVPARTNRALLAAVFSISAATLVVPSVTSRPVIALSTDNVEPAVVVTSPV